MMQGDYLRAIASAGTGGLCRVELAALTPLYLRYLRVGLRSGIIEQTGTGRDRRFRIIDPLLIDAIAPSSAANVQEVEPSGDDCNDGGACV